LKKHWAGGLENIKIIKFADMKCCIRFALGFCLLILLSCSSTTEQKKETKVEQQPAPSVKQDNFQTGNVLDKVTCRADSSQSYALYLPAGYTEGKLYPVVFAFDPQGKGNLPVNNYKALAEKHQYIIVGSNNSKNGLSWEETQKISNLFFADVQGRFHVNAQRIYALGFSGGARIANGLTASNGSITGVICCGAATPAKVSPNPRSNYFFMGIAGNEDFNYVELKKYDKVDLAGHNIKHSLLVFDGKHEWPPLATMDEAFWWMELNQMRRNSASKKDSLVEKNIRTATVELQTHLGKKQLLAAYECCRKTINFYESLGDLSLFFTTYQSLQSSKEIDIALQKEEADWAQEENLKKKYIEAVQSNDANWWKNDIAVLNRKINNSSRNESLIYKRVLSYLSLMMYMQTVQFMSQNNTAAADYFSKLYLLVDPKNAEAHYLAAALSAIQGNQADAFKFLNSAVNNGYEDKIRLESDANFRNMRASAAFQKIITQLNG
jgi:poly(3-hydroxybutyrate) depolymerase